MGRKPNPYLIDEDAPELTDEELASARPLSEVLPRQVFDGLAKRKPGERGPGKAPAKVALTIRVEPDVLQAWRASGEGWQARAREVLAREAPKIKRRA
ncbi:BrnA antitoxin family protein [Enterovirga rhinocerotis]|uniref:Uncharacterized protein (DUF4415 family) n=1 Tax=Enterovirga rhinocerotis TaxID=1339210 RepID=A0A4R7BWU6_9HYPH|nr:BrnA antitoxin family protein [Enterovirga rhinocerotis]TDR89662.1 uncharacterized protein (DUF4415 family) [Enterovirga rhinocerotis]